MATTYNTLYMDIRRRLKQAGCTGAGLEARPTSDGDYEIYGQERWSQRDQARLMGWLRRFGQWVWQALYDKEFAPPNGRAM